MRRRNPKARTRINSVDVTQIRESGRVPLAGASEPVGGLSMHVRTRDRHHRADRAETLIWLPISSRSDAAKPTNAAADRRYNELARSHRRTSSSRGACAPRGRRAATVPPFRRARGPLSVRVALDTASALLIPARAHCCLHFFVLAASAVSRRSRATPAAPQPRDYFHADCSRRVRTRRPP